MSNCYYALFSALFIFSMGTTSHANIDVSWQQTANFWSILSQIEKGSGTLDTANQLLNQTYGKPEGDQIGIFYRPHQITESQIELREIRVDQVGYAVSSNPVLPRIFAWAGFGPQITAGWNFIEIYGGRYWAKKVEAVSTDIIDRRVLESNQVNFFGLGLNTSHDFNELIANIPLKIEAKTRHTQFTSNANETYWYHRWRLDITGDVTKLFPKSFPAAVKGILILGPQPVPSFDARGLIWDYLWKVDPFSDALSMVGIGTRVDFESVQGLYLNAGFYSGYWGMEIGISPLSWFSVNVQSFAVETTTAFQAQGIRFWGAGMKFEF